MNGNARSQGITPGQVRELLIRLLAAMPLGMSNGAAQWFIHRPDLLGELLGGTIKPYVNVAEEMASWDIFYRHVFNIFMEVTHMRLPDMIPGLGSLLVVGRDLTPGLVLSAAKRLRMPFECYTDDIDNDLIGGSNDRFPDLAYVIWVWDKSREPEEVLNSLSPSELKKESVVRLTLTEMLILHLKCFFESGEVGRTYCSIPTCAGTTNRNGDIPLVYRELVGNGKLRIGLHSPPQAK